MVYLLTKNLNLCFFLERLGLENVGTLECHLVYFVNSLYIF
jgi:hypothetical protein